jgi:hemoglobin
MSAQPIPTLYEWAGGIDRLLQLTGVFYEKVKLDPLIGPVFAAMSAEHPRHVAQFIAEVFGGPKAYSAEHGAQAHHHMIGQHVGRHLTEQQRRRWIELLVDSADEIKLPDDPEFRSAFVAYLEWGTRLGVMNSQLEAPPPEVGPMPKWGWGEVGGPYRPAGIA